MLLSEFFENVYRPLKLRSRSANTVRLYRYSVKAFGNFLQRPATLHDLTDEQVSAHLAGLLERKLSPYSVTKERSQLLAIWNYAARKGHIARWPDVEKEVTPKRAAIAWSKGELQRLVKACLDEPGEIAGVPACDWWRALHFVLWDSAERVGAVLQLRWDNLGADGWLRVPAEVRKCRREDRVFLLRPNTLEALDTIRQPARKLIFPWERSPTTIYHRYGKILERAGLPNDARSKFHRMRRTAASFYELAGGNATDLLGHTNREVTKRYLDPRVVKMTQPSQVLFDIDEGRKP